MIENMLRKAVAMPLFVRFRSLLEDGYYTWEHSNPQDIIRLKPNSAIYIESIGFSASCKVWDFSAAADDGIGVQFSTKSGREPVLLRELRFFSFADYMTINGIVQGLKPLTLNYNANRQDDYLTIAVNGRVRQTEALIKENKSGLEVLLSVVAYELTDKDVINQLNRNYSEPEGTPPVQFSPAKNLPPAPYVDTQDAPPPNAFKQVRVWSRGQAKIQAWENERNSENLENMV